MPCLRGDQDQASLRESPVHVDQLPELPPDRQGGRMKFDLGRYSKFITGAIGQALTFASLYYGTNHYVVLAVAIAAALGVYAVPNKQPPVT